jgi:hypothetical protein
MKSTLFTTLTVNEEVSLSGGWYGADYYKDYAKKYMKKYDKYKPEPPKPPVTPPKPKPEPEKKHPAAIIIFQIGNEVAVGINNGTINVNN